MTPPALAAAPDASITVSGISLGPENAPQAINEIDKTNFRWGKNQSVKLDENTTKKIKASDFLWEQTGYGSTQGGLND